MGPILRSAVLMMPMRSLSVVVTKKILSEAEARELFRMCVSPMLLRRDSCEMSLLSDVCGGRFYHGCSTFLPVFDASVDTYDALHERSPFAVDCICMVAAKVRDGGGMYQQRKPRSTIADTVSTANPSDIFMKCSEEVQAISCATLFSPVTRQEAVQAMGK